MSFIVKYFEFYWRQQKEKYGSMYQMFTLYKIYYDRDTRS